MSTDFISCLHLTILKPQGVGVVLTKLDIPPVSRLFWFDDRYRGIAPNKVHVTLDTDIASKLTICCSYSYSGSNKYSMHVLVVLISRLFWSRRGRMEGTF